LTTEQIVNVQRPSNRITGRDIFHNSRTHILISQPTVDSSHYWRRIRMFEFRLRRIISVLLVVSQKVQQRARDFLDFARLIK
jgi:hypothetical protein